jgi:hypothetical protein
MPELFERAEIEPRVGDRRQVGGITPIVYDDGRARGTCGFLVHTAPA